MADDINNIKGTPLPGQSQPLVETKETAANSSSGVLSGGGELGQDEFLQMLVTQLQHQDPLNPMSNEEFAVQLAQFSQLEQLIGINDKFDGSLSGGAGDVGTMASFLGHEIVLKDQTANISGGKGPNVTMDVPEGAIEVRLDLIDETGTVVTSQQIEGLSGGNQAVPLNNLNVANGAYDVRAIAVTANGQFAELDTKLTGTVEGFVLEPEPALIVNGANVSLEDVSEVVAAG